MHSLEPWDDEMRPVEGLSDGERALKEEAAPTIFDADRRRAYQGTPIPAVVPAPTATPEPLAHCNNCGAYMAVLDATVAPSDIVDGVCIKCASIVLYRRNRVLEERIVQGRAQNSRLMASQDALLATISTLRSFVSAPAINEDGSEDTMLYE